MDPESAHELAARALARVTRPAFVRRLMRRFTGAGDRRLEVRALGLTFPSPLGVAAGLDKGGTWFEGLGALGFGFVEVGTVTATAQPGNDAPRVFRLTPDRALLNRMGFPNPGAAVVADRLGSRETIVGVNVGKSMAAPLAEATEDYRASIRQVAPFADYLVVNVSSPNTPGLRDMQAAELLEPLVAAVRGELEAAGIDIPLLVKIGPDLTDAQLDEVADLAVRLGVDGIVAVNTTTDRTGLTASADTVAQIEGGGISGAPLKDRALEVLRRLYARAGGRLVLISVGGIEAPQDAWERILAGATLVQAYTGFIYGGPAWPRRMNRGLARLARASGRSSIGELVGTGARPHGNQVTGASPR